MLLLQLTTEFLVLAVLTLVLVIILKKFNRRDLFIYLFIPLFFFTIGFTMRLSGQTPVVDLGFFFTEMSSIWLYLLFVLALLLGQIKYWKK